MRRMTAPRNLRTFIRAPDGSRPSSTPTAVHHEIKARIKIVHKRLTTSAWMAIANTIGRSLWSENFHDN